LQTSRERVTFDADAHTVNFGSTQMQPNRPRSRTESTPAERVAAPTTQAKAKRLSPAYALAWLHLMPDSVFPIRSRDDMATKVSALLFSSALGQAQGDSHSLPAGTQQKPRAKKAAR
jgi:hypothetical protein